MLNLPMTIRNHNQDRFLNILISTKWRDSTCSKSHSNRTTMRCKTSTKVPMVEEIHNKSLLTKVAKTPHLTSISLSQIHMLDTKSKMMVMMVAKKVKRRWYLLIQSQKSLLEVLISSFKMKIWNNTFRYMEQLNQLLFSKISILDNRVDSGLLHSRMKQLLKI